MKIKHSCSIILLDPKLSIARTVISLDRTDEDKFTNKELQNIAHITPLLSVLNNHFCKESPLSAFINRSIKEDGLHLTPREKEIVRYLCQGVKPSNISYMLSITPATVRKHIENIYKKVGVNNRQELMVRFIGNPESK